MVRNPDLYPLRVSFARQVKRVVFDLQPASHEDEMAFHDCSAPINWMGLIPLARFDLVVAAS